MCSDVRGYGLRKKLGRESNYVPRNPKEQNQISSRRRHIDLAFFPPPFRSSKLEVAPSVLIT
jgi:hypothetical protein